MDLPMSKLIQEKCCLKIVTLLMSLTIFSQIQAAENLSGCLVKVKKRIVSDPACKCAVKKICAKAKTFTYSKKFFDSKDINNKALFSDKEKKAYQESYKVLNKIMELKSSGKGKSPEITKYYIQLEKINAEIDALLRKNHPKFTAATDKRQSEQAQKRKVRNEKRDKLINEFLENQGKIPPVRAAAPKPAVEHTVQLQKTQPAPASVTPVLVTQKTDGLSNDDKEIILKNLKDSEYEVKEDDSLFDIISKTYKSKAYKRLLAPVEAQE